MSIEGRKGGNFACDSHGTQIDPLKCLCGLGANITDSGKHSLVSVADDAKQIVNELHGRSKVLEEIPGRMHPNSKTNRFVSYCVGS